MLNSLVVVCMSMLHRYSVCDESGIISKHGQDTVPTSGWFEAQSSDSPTQF